MRVHASTSSSTLLIRTLSHACRRALAFVAFAIGGVASSAGAQGGTGTITGRVIEAEVRARVAAATAQQLGPSLGMNDARLLSGSVVDGPPGDGLTLKVASVPAGVAGVQDGLFQQIYISRAELLELESRRLDAGRTRLAVGAGVVGAAVLAATMLRGHSSGESTVTEPPANFNLAILRFRSGPLRPVFGAAWIGGRAARLR